MSNTYVHVMRPLSTQATAWRTNMDRLSQMSAQLFSLHMIVQVRKQPRRTSLHGGRNAACKGSGQSCRKSECQNVLVCTVDCQDTDIATRTHLYVVTLNCHSLSVENKLEELQNELKRTKWDIIGLSEVWRKNEKQLGLPSGYRFYFKGTENGKPTGVDFKINKDLKTRIT